MALEKPCEFSEENFAGDPLVREFCESLRAEFDVDMKIYVSWACPPNVVVVKSKVGNAIIRSERLDTLLVEFHHLRRVQKSLSGEMAREVVSSLILRWMCELLLGFKRPDLAIFAQTLRSQNPEIRAITGGVWNPFRDETLASVHPLERTAIQCFCLAHEVGHLLNERRVKVSLETEVDGLSIVRHLERSASDSGVSDEVLEVFRTIWERRLDAENLMSEVDADLFAFGCVVQFLSRGLSYPLEDSIEATLRAFEAQLFIHTCKHSCRLLRQHATRALGEGDFVERSYLEGAEYLVRARATVRRAGILWAVLDHPAPPPKGRPYNAYVERVDSMLAPGEAMTSLVMEILVRHERTLFRAIEQDSDAGQEGWFDVLLEFVKDDADLRLDFYYILVAFGCAGSVDVVDYLRGMRGAA